MASLKGNRQFCTVSMFMVCCMLWTSYLNEGKEVSFYIQGDDVIFEGDHFQLACAYSSEDVSNVSLSISSKEHNSIIIPSERNGTYTQTIVLFFLFSGNDTFVCTVESGQKTETIGLPIVAIPREFPYCKSNSSNEIIEGDGILLSCYADVNMMDIKWVTNTSNVTQPGETLLSTTRKKEAVIRPFENETGIIYTCQVPSSENNTSECSVGPINVYKAIVLNIQPTSPDSLHLSPGRNQQFNCISEPEYTVVNWEMSHEDHKINIQMKGKSITVKVPSDSKFTGMINLTCVGAFGMHTASKSITLHISNNDTPVALLYYILGGLTLLIVLIVFLFLALGCKKFITLRRRVEIYDVKRKRGSSQSHLRNDYPQSTLPDGNGVDNHTVFIDNDADYYEASRNEECMDASKAGGDLTDIYAIIPEGQSKGPPKNVGQHANAQGDESQLYVMTDRNNSGGFQSTDDRSLRDHRAMSVVYAIPNRGRVIAEKEEDVVGRERDPVVVKKKTDTPPYAVVNKRRLIIIQDETTDEDKLEDIDEDNSSYV